SAGHLVSLSTGAGEHGLQRQFCGAHLVRRKRSGTATRVAEVGRSPSFASHYFPRTLRQTGPAGPRTPEGSLRGSGRLDLERRRTERPPARRSVSPVRSGTRAVAARESDRAGATGTYSSAGSASHSDRLLVSRNTPG